MKPWTPQLSEASPVAGHVLVVGAGGLGCPALWGLAASGVTRLRIVDHDVVERSNLPRQVLFSEAEIGQPKARVAAHRMAEARARLPGSGPRGAKATGGVIEGRAVPFDETHADSLLVDVDVVIDATDGARTKDWIHREAVRRGIPLIHAAALRSEGRLLAVPVGGRPCLGCLFGRLTEETGRCADLGVWNTAVGTTGFLAADLAVRVLEGDAPAPTYHVLDFAGGSSLPLGVTRDEACPVCGAHASDAPEPLPPGEACAVTETGAQRPEELAGSLDLRAERCPVNLLRASETLAAASVGDVWRMRLGAEGRATVPGGLREAGHEVLFARVDGDGLDLYVRAEPREAGDREATLDAETRERFARQLVLPEIGLVGQRRLGAATVELAGGGLAVRSARRYLEAAGVGHVRHVAGDGVVAARVLGGDAHWFASVALDGALTISADRSAVEGGAAPLESCRPAQVLALGSLLADVVLRSCLGLGASGARLGANP